MKPKEISGYEISNMVHNTNTFVEYVCWNETFQKLEFRMMSERTWKLENVSFLSWMEHSVEDSGLEVKD